MTRFDAADPAERRQLYADAITAHRTRGSAYLTLEVDESELDEETNTGIAADDPRANGENVDEIDESDSDLGVPWIQFGDGIVNLDCTESELETVKAVLEEFPAFSIDALTWPENADGVNVRVSARADPNRVAQFFDAVFQRVYDCPQTYRVWVVEL
ncbi:hypothetical protein D8Y22_12675 [Salinadaptatus halalkaliphilus]|uniref:DUF7975 domain-containing protein n=1 Tax=Salinadaptatus halalkaliphilus TaxID=2419781 RepID=A0A4S3TK60_9EURY|nr:hypothetical protein [Salinadaptatus halalkaliphilus]THE64492.1 hypothetical protein D8Y22_12675 [Salinadaptatus halalkaliphilus]